MVSTERCRTAERSSKSVQVVVLVDDEAPVLSSLRRLLRNEPYEVLSTTDPHEALRWILERPVAAVVADQKMPGMTGSALLEEVRKSSPGTVRILLTGYADPDSMKKWSQEDIQKLITKPWDDAELKRFLRSAVPEKKPE